MTSPRMSRRRVLAGLGTVPLAAAAALPETARDRPAGPADAPGDRRPTLLRGADLVLTMDPRVGDGPLGRLENGVDVLLRDGTVAAVGRGLTAPAGARIRDARGRIVLPGFVDVHTHLWQAGIRGGCANEDLHGWLRSCNTPALAGLGPRPQDMYRLVRLAALNALQAGVTTVVDWVHPVPYDTGAAYVRALDDAGLRFVYAATQRAADAHLIPRIKRDFLDPLPLASAQVSAQAGMDRLKTLRTLHEVARDLGVMFNSHVLERREDRAHDPIRSLREIGAFGPELLMNHAIHLTDEEIALTGEHDVRIAHCPLSNMRLASGICPLPAFHRHAVKAGLGHDGGTDDTTDMFNLMKTAVGLQRARHEDAGIHPTLPAALRMATLGGAEVIGMADRIGSLTPGKRADVVVLDPGTLNFAPRHDWTAQIVLAGQPPNVSEVFVDGHPRKAQGELLHVDVERVVHEAESAARHIRGA
ncbi:amidohydrolase family protein [Streptomyces sp. NPDC057555]|uniref:amidohydrolase family protein n=1 Tax=Streptomyces sp. NPDC057555 TaxID=3346166 RepID=UPI0036D081D6